MGLEETIKTMERALDEAESARTRIDTRWAEDVKAEAEKQISGSLAERMAELRAEALQEGETARSALAAKEYTARQAGQPQGAEAWAEAAARVQFVREQVEKMQPAEIVEAYHAAKAAGDLVGAFLYLREGIRHLEAMIADKAKAPGGGGRAVGQALQELKGAEVGSPEAERQRRASEAKIQEALSRAISTSARGMPKSKPSRIDY